MATEDYLRSRRIFLQIRRGESKCIKPRARDVDLWFKIWEELHGLAEKGMLVEVEHVKAHRTKEEKDMSHFEKFVTERVYGGSKSRYCAARKR